nr:MAG TPA: hypothetical protein [Caudoviricetes sp.]
MGIFYIIVTIYSFKALRLAFILCYNVKVAER